MKHKYIVTYDLLLADGVERCEVYFRYFETCIATIHNLHKHCDIDNISIRKLQEVTNMYYKDFLLIMLFFGISIFIICATATSPVTQLAALNIVFIAFFLFMDTGGGDE